MYFPQHSPNQLKDTTTFEYDDSPSPDVVAGIKSFKHWKLN